MPQQVFLWELRICIEMKKFNQQIMTSYLFSGSLGEIKHNAMQHKGSVFLNNICSIHYALALAVPAGREIQKDSVIHCMTSAFVSEMTSTAHKVGLISFILWLGPWELGGGWRTVTIHQWWPELGLVCPTSGPGLFLPYYRAASVLVSCYLYFLLSLPCTHLSPSSSNNLKIIANTGGFTLVMLIPGYAET